MITEKDLQEAIAECQGQKNPNANTCMKLAAFYTIKDHMFSGTVSEESVKPISALERPRVAQSYSYASAPPAAVRYDSGSEFCTAIRRKNIEDVLPVVDELMETLNIINPRLYESVLSKLSC